MNLPATNRGVALITVLLVVFLASAAAAALATLQQTEIRRSTVVLHEQQARLYALGAERWAVEILRRDATDSDTDHLGEPWAAVPPALPVDGGYVTGRLEDLQARFNLNNLRLPDGSQDPVQIAFLERLLDLLEIDPTLTAAIGDWTDADLNTSGVGGAEDPYYLTLAPPYLTANRPMASVSELRLVRGVDDVVYARLAPFVSALPQRTPVNVNTAPAEVLTAIDPDSDPNRIALSIEQRERGEFVTVADFLDAAGLAETPYPTENLAVASNYFRTSIEARVGEGRTRLSSVLARQETDVRVVHRRYALED